MSCVSKCRPKSECMIGKTISHFRIVSQIGGGMCVVYEAEDLKLRRHLALKFRQSCVAL